MSAGLDATVTVTRGSFRLQVALSVPAGRTVAVVGPNGAGKSTLLRALAGLEPVEAGHIVLDGEVLDDPSTGAWVPPERRAVGLMFQRSLLFPHLTAVDNVAFGLRGRGRDRPRAREVAQAWLERLGVGACAAMRPSALSGGQAQRVALARALAPEPQLLLLDEPLAAVDAPSRVVLRRELRSHLGAFGGAQVLVTHDPVEALDLASEVVVVEGGLVVQAGTPEALRARPASPYVAALVGVNQFRGRRRGGVVEVEGGASLTVAAAAAGDRAGDGAGDQEVIAIVHPESVSLHRDRPAGSPRNVWPASVVGLHLHGERVRVTVAGPVPLVSDVTPAAVAELGLAPGTDVWASVKATEIELHQA